MNGPERTTPKLQEGRKKNQTDPGAAKWPEAPEEQEQQQQEEEEQQQPEEPRTVPLQRNENLKSRTSHGV